MTDVVYSEAEYAILLTRLKAYSDFLSGSITKYQGILDYLMNNAIHDEQIVAKILTLKGNVMLYSEQLDEIQTSTKAIVAKLAEDLEDADKVVLPDEEMSRFQALFSLFR